jgi:hypothetical protein
MVNESVRDTTENCCNKIMRYNCDLFDMDNYEHIKTFKYNYIIGSPVVYVNIRLKSFPVSTPHSL